MNSHRVRQYFINPFGKVNNFSELKKVGIIVNITSQFL